MASLMNSTKYLRKKLYWFSTILLEDRNREIFHNSLYEARIDLIPKPIKDIIRNWNYKPVSLINISPTLEAPHFSKSWKVHHQEWTLM